MLKKNFSRQRCLVLTKNSDTREIVHPFFATTLYIVDYFDDRKNAVRCFLQYKHSLVIIDAQFLPRFAFRLVQFFKIAHRVAAVVVLNAMKKNCTGFERLERHAVRVVNEPFTRDTIQAALTGAIDEMNRMTRAVFLRNLLIQAGAALPVAALVVYMVVRG